MLKDRILVAEQSMTCLMKEGLRGKHYSSVEEVKSAVKKWLKEQSTEFYGAGINALIRRSNIVIE